jgi:hypothetical protein
MEENSSMVSVDVITYVHKDEQMLANCIAGLLNQKVEFKWHVLCYQELKENLKGLAPNIHLLSEEIDNKAKAYNLILPLLNADYIAFNDADDISLPNRFESQTSYMEDHPEIDILGGGLIINEKHPGWRVYQNHDKIVDFLAINNPMVNSTVMLRNNPTLWGIKVAYETSLERAEDYKFWLQCAKTGLRFANLPQELISYYQTNKDNRLERQCARVIREEAFKYITGNSLSGSFKDKLHLYAENESLNLIERFFIKRKINQLINQRN